MNHATTASTITAPASLLQRIALDHFFVETLQTRHCDSLDFHDVSVWAIESALQAAFAAGYVAAGYVAAGCATAEHAAAKQEAASKKQRPSKKVLKTA